MDASIDDLLSGSSDSDSIIYELVLRTIEQVAKQNQPLAEVMLAAAIPHRFTLEILESLELTRNANLPEIALSYLGHLSFVREIESGVFSFHEDVRNAILRYWRSDIHRQKYLEYSRRLRDFFMVSEQVNEMLYHWLVVEPEVAFLGYRYRIQALLDRRDILECEVLLRLAHEQDWPKSSLHLAFLALAEATLYIQLDKWERAIEASRRILSTDVTNEIRAIALLDLGTGLNYLGKWTEAKDHLEEATKLFLQLGQAVPDAFLSLGWSYFRLGKQANAFAAFQNALGLAQSIGHAPAQGAALNNLGAYYFSSKRWDISEKYYEKALRVRQALNGNDFFIGRSFQNLANVYLQQNKIEDAMSSAKRALLIQEKMDDQFGLSFSLEILGVAFQELGDSEKAIEFLERSLSIRRHLAAKKEIADTLMILSKIYDKQGRKNESHHYAAEADALRSALYPQNY